MLPVFWGLANENPYQHVRKFEDICGTHEVSSNDRGFPKTYVIPLFSKRKSQILASFSPTGFNFYLGKISQSLL